MGIRYSKVEGKFQREIVLLKSFPCAYGKCSFCNYIEDNSNNEEEINRVNLGVLKEITGEFGILEVINSGSVFEIPKKTLEKIREVVYEKDIKIYNHEDVKLDPKDCGLNASPTQVFRSFTPPVKGKGEMLQGSNKDMAKQLVVKLKEKHLI